MTRAAQQILKTFESLPETDQQELAVEILRRAPIEVRPDLKDSDFLLLADQVFLELDRSEESE
jgi:hypothetical protein